MSAVLLGVEYQIGGGQSEPTLTRLSTAFERAGAELAQVGKHILPRLIPILETQTAAQFDAEGGGPSTGSWAPLSVNYKRWKEAHYPGRPILVLTGKLREALTSSSSSNAQRAVSGDSLTYGTKGIPYASAHQTGTGDMPARPPFDFGPAFEAEMRKAAMAGTREAIREASAGVLDFEGDTYTDEGGVARQVLTGRSGGRYFVGGDGRKTYLKRDASGKVIKRTFGKGKR